MRGAETVIVLVMVAVVLLAVVAGGQELAGVVGPLVIVGCGIAWVIWHFSITRHVFKASNLIGKYMGDQIFRIHTLKLRRHSLTVTIALNGE